MKPFHFSLSLRLHHPNMDHREISQQLNMVPKRAWTAGDRRIDKQGTPLDGDYDCTYWVGTLVESASGNIGDELLPWLERLQTDASFLSHFCATGGRIELFVGWFMDAPSAGETLTWSILNRLGALQIDLSLDVYR
jgi:hypothetical protein